MPAKKTSRKSTARAARPTRTDTPDPIKAQLESAQANSDRMQPGRVETDATTGQRVIHPAANPQQVNPLSDKEHENAATKEADVLVDQDKSAREKREATAVSNLAAGNSPAAETNQFLPKSKQQKSK